ncbi:MAG: hypothetical protein QW100_01495 [Thermoplasmatales archaeon]
MRCVFSDLRGVCHYKYPGYRCIEEECEVWGIFNAMENECVYLDNKGCWKLNLLACKGRENCVYFREHFDNPNEVIRSRENEK